MTFHLFIYNITLLYNRKEAMRFYFYVIQNKMGEIVKPLLSSKIKLYTEIQSLNINFIIKICYSSRLCS